MLIRLLWILCFTVTAFSKPLQFCKEDVAANYAFCLAISTFKNYTTAFPSVDLYTTIITERLNASSAGWIGIGLGPQMHGSLMFVIFGDPYSHSQIATTVVRAGMGHALVDPSAKFALGYFSIPRIDILSAKFSDFDDEASVTAPAKVLEVQLVCYNCSTWALLDFSPQTVDTESDSQPILWAINSDQNFGGSFDDSARIEAHNFHGTLQANLRASAESSLDQELATIPQISRPYRPWGISETTLTQAVAPSSSHDVHATPSPGLAVTANWALAVLAGSLLICSIHIFRRHRKMWTQRASYMHETDPIVEQHCT
ncbi:hypothetical protein NA57DRAFT_50551 [Rhizodiscina lignyota]|uniref:Cellobiose dehydrogenase-like cytochrome domain-containing protein n=1 Tax=Rhizodiscina lignyota TaxID=1504668 RepID=A0A9P4IM64_9PEZI|nr:hypothetical protein NA57DRAFT_50551 [Rhizodiscina lignyota]